MISHVKIRFSRGVSVPCKSIFSYFVALQPGIEKYFYFGFGFHVMGINKIFQIGVRI
jgi:hypothetical protein